MSFRAYPLCSSTDCTPLESIQFIAEILNFNASLWAMVHNLDQEQVANMPKSNRSFEHLGRLGGTLIDDAYGHLNNLETNVRKNQKAK